MLCNYFPLYSAIGTDIKDRLAFHKVFVTFINVVDHVFSVFYVKMQHLLDLGGTFGRVHAKKTCPFQENRSA